METQESNLATNLVINIDNKDDEQLLGRKRDAASLNEGTAHSADAPIIQNDFVNEISNF